MDFLKKAAAAGLDHAIKEVEKQALKKYQSRAAGDAPLVDDAQYQENAAKAVPGDVKMISGCQDSQTSADVGNVSKYGLPDSNGAGGACTSALLRCLYDHPEPTYAVVLKTLRDILRTDQFSQVPQLSTSRSIALDGPFSVRPGGGNCKALMIGINYVGQGGELRGCHNDVASMKKYIVSKGYSEDPSHMKLLLDDGHHEQPTRDNIEAGFNWLIQGAKEGDNLFFHYSGHGGSTADDDGDEADGLDETLVPVDYGAKGQVRDDEVFDKLIRKVPAGVHMFVVMDCCHSGTILDLPYALKGDDLTLGRIDSGEQTTTVPNAAFAMRLLKLGLELARDFSQGKSAEEIQKKAIAEITKEIPVPAMKSMFASFSSMMSKK